MAQCCAINLLLPIGIRRSQRFQSYGLTLIACINTLDEVAIFVGIQHIQALPACAQRHVAGVRHPYRLVSVPTFRGDDDDTIRTSRTIDGRGRGIFQHIKTLYILRVDHRQRIGHALNTLVSVGHTIIIHRHAVDHNQRVVGSVERTATANADAGAASRCSATRCDAHTCHLSLHQILCIHHQSSVLTIGLELCHRTGQVRFLHGTITNHHHFVQCLVVILERCREIVGRNHFLWRHTHIGNGQLCPFRHINHIVSIKVSNANSFAVCHNRCTDDGLACCIFDLAFQASRLSKSHCRQK